MSCGVKCDESNAKSCINLSLELVEKNAFTTFIVSSKIFFSIALKENNNFSFSKADKRNFSDSEPWRHLLICLVS
jgi:hypothetical protein